MTAATSVEELIAEYEHRMAPARRTFASGNAINVVMSPEVDAAFLELFLIHFCAYGVRMTEPVEGWINRAADRCGEMGLDDIATALHRHAHAEAGHHLMMLADVKALVDRWNTRQQVKLDSRHLLDRPTTSGAARYCQLHEENIRSAQPFAQFAIEYEIEMLPVQYGPALIKQCMERLGRDILSCMSFLTEHVELDVGHTKFNAQQLRRVLAARPESVANLVAQGSGILDAYAEFLQDCVTDAEEFTRCLQ